MRKIMYIGKKATKTDNVNAVPSRIWRGLGDVVEIISDLEAAKLCVPAFDAIWRDVTDLKVEDQRALVSAFQDQFRAEARKQAEMNKTNVNPALLSDEELLRELEHRQKLKGAPPVLTDPKVRPQGAGPVGNRGAEDGEGERPKNTDQLLNDIIQAIGLLDKDNKSHYDGQGRPNVEAIRGLVGYNVSQSELDHAVKQIKSAE
jgi:hypothetical protein